jgi:hypothetical protein
VWSTFRRPLGFIALCRVAALGCKAFTVWTNGLMTQCRSEMGGVHQDSRTHSFSTSACISEDFLLRLNSFTFIRAIRAGFPGLLDDGCPKHSRARKGTVPKPWLPRHLHQEVHVGCFTIPLRQLLSGFTISSFFHMTPRQALHTKEA